MTFQQIMVVKTCGKFLCSYGLVCGARLTQRPTVVVGPYLDFLFLTHSHVIPCPVHIKHPPYYGPNDVEIPH